MRRRFRLGRSAVIYLLVCAANALAQNDAALLIAVKNQDHEALQALIRKRVDVNTRQPDGATPLHWAVHREDVEAASLLIRAGANVNVTNDLGITPLYMASTASNSAISVRLLAAGADPDAALPSGETPLMAAARSGSTGTVKALLDRKAAVDAREGTRGQTALMWATANRHPDVTRLLIERGAAVSARSQTRSRIFLLGVNRTLSVASADSPVARTDEGGSTPLLFAARSGDIESARLLVAAGADVNDTAADGNTALVIAAHSGHSSLAAFLLEQGADANAEPLGYAALHAAVLRGNLRDRNVPNDDPQAGVPLVKALLAHGADPNRPFTRPTRIRRGSHDFVLMERWVGATPFWLAAKFLEIDMMRALVAAGADPRIPSGDGTTPLMAAAGLGYSRGGGDSSNIRDRRDFSHYNPGSQDSTRIPEDEEKRTLEAVTVAVELGADINALNRSGDTALHAAAALGMNPVVEWLVQRGADVNASGSGGRTPLQVARRDTGGGSIKRESTADLLKRLGAIDTGPAPARRR